MAAVSPALRSSTASLAGNDPASDLGAHTDTVDDALDGISGASHQLRALAALTAD